MSTIFFCEIANKVLSFLFFLKRYSNDLLLEIWLILITDLVSSSTSSKFKKVSGVVVEASSDCEKTNINIEYKDLKYWKPNDHRKSLLKIVENEGSKNLKELLDTNKSEITHNLRKNLLFGKNLNDDVVTNIKSEFKFLKNSLEDLFIKFDVILMPTTPQSSFNKKSNIPDNQANFTSLANIADLPSISIPIFEHNKMPFSLQILSSNMNDKYLLKISSYFEKILQ
jgi:Asp-tRNA(Asn)/Glu-tRNA(Gln) amidotransferase A subunit family amidase